MQVAMKDVEKNDQGLFPGHIWHENGQSSYFGDLLTLYKRLDSLFLSWASDFKAEEYSFPSAIKTSELNKMDYFRSFPHLVTFPASLQDDPSNLKRFSESPLGKDGVVQLTEVQPIRDVLTPAACYHFYVNFQNEDLQEARYVTTRCTCYRRENHYLPLQRQWCFSMREIVCIGTEAEVTSFLKENETKVSAFFDEIGLAIKFENASDPFFEPIKNPQFIYQKLNPVKTEMIFGGKLAIGSTNFHRSHFGGAFKITRAGTEAYSGCVAFGIDRWIYAWIKTFGRDPAAWPKLPIA